MKSEFTPQQRNALYEWAAEGLRLPQVRERAADFDPPFEVDYLQLRYARKQTNKKFREWREQFEAEAGNDGLSRRAVRLRQLEELYDKHLELIRARGDDMANEVLGGDTGLMVRDYKGKDADRPIYKYDAALIREMRGILDDIAKELGERKTNVDVSGSGEILLKVQYGDDGAKSNPDNSTAETSRTAESVSE